jgi:hypothetical protein
MLEYKVYKNTYWNGVGKYQNFVTNTLDNNKIDSLQIPKTLKLEYHNLAHAYYRFYNDGDIPRHKIFRNKNQEEISVLLEIEINKIIEKIQKLV